MNGMGPASRHKTHAHVQRTVEMSQRLSGFFTLRLLVERAREPVEALVQAVAGGRASRLDVPVALAERVQAELVGDLSSIHRVRQVLFVGEHQQDRLAQLVLIEHAVQLVARLTHAIAVVRVDHEDDALGILVVMAPQRADLVLAAHICECEAGWSEAGKRGESDLQGGRVEGVACELWIAHPRQ